MQLKIETVRSRDAREYREVLSDFGYKESIDEDGNIATHVTINGPEDLFDLVEAVDYPVILDTKPISNVETPYIEIYDDYME